MCPAIVVIAEILGIEPQAPAAVFEDVVLVDKIQERIALLVDIRQTERAHVRQAA